MGLSGYQMLKAAMTSELGTGGEFLSDGKTSEFIGLIRERTFCRQLFPSVTMKKAKITIPKIISGTTLYYTPPGQVATPSGIGTDQITLESKKLMGHVFWDAEVDEDSMIAIAPLLKNDLAGAAAESEELAMMQGDPEHSATKDDPKKATENDWFERDPRLMFPGMVKLSKSEDAATPLNLSNSDLTPADILMAKFNLGKYGRNNNNLVFLVNNYTAMKMILWEELLTIDKYGPNATIITGEIGKVMNISTVDTSWMPYGEAVLTLKGNGIIGDRRKIKFASEFIPSSDTMAVYPSERVDFKVPRVDALCNIYGLPKPA